MELLDINGDGMFKNCSTRSRKYWLGVNYLKANATLRDIGLLCDREKAIMICICCCKVHENHDLFTFHYFACSLILIYLNYFQDELLPGWTRI